MHKTLTNYIQLFTMIAISMCSVCKTVVLLKNHRMCTEVESYLFMWAGP